MSVFPPGVHHCPITNLASDPDRFKDITTPEGKLKRALDLWRGGDEDKAAFFFQEGEGDRASWSAQNWHYCPLEGNRIAYSLLRAEYQSHTSDVNVWSQTLYTAYEQATSPTMKDIVSHDQGREALQRLTFLLILVSTFVRQEPPPEFLVRLSAVTASHRAALKNVVNALQGSGAHEEPTSEGTAETDFLNAVARCIQDPARLDQLKDLKACDTWTVFIKLAICRRYGMTEEEALSSWVKALDSKQYPLLRKYLSTMDRFDIW